MILHHRQQTPGKGSRTGLLFLFLLLTLIVFSSSSTMTADSTLPLPNHAHIIAEDYLAEESSPCLWCTQISFTPAAEILVSSKNSTLFFRSPGIGTFTASPLALSQPHSMIHNQFDNLFYISDTENNRLLIVADVGRNSIEKEITTIDNTALIRPHDIVINAETGWMYTINPETSMVFKFHHQHREEYSLDLSAVLGYSRALSLINGRLFVAGSSHGRIVEIIDFAAGQYRVYQSHGKRAFVSRGSWKTSGLVINDIDHFQGYFYVSSYFTTSSPMEQAMPNILIRFSNWHDFESGNWEDMSAMLPAGLVPYYLTIHGDTLYIPLFNHQHPGQGDTIFSLMEKGK